jgi:hypothetical protein
LLIQAHLSISDANFQRHRVGFDGRPSVYNRLLGVQQEDNRSDQVVPKEGVVLDARLDGADGAANESEPAEHDDRRWGCQLLTSWCFAIVETSTVEASTLEPYFGTTVIASINE